MKGIDMFDFADQLSEDPELVVRLIDGDHTALAEIYRRHASQVLGVARRLIRDEAAAHDVVQDVFVALWNRPGAFDSTRGSLRSFLLTKAHSRTIDIIRSESSRRSREEREMRLVSEGGVAVDEEVWTLSVVDEVRAALTVLPDRERDVIELAFYEGLTYREVATHLDLAEGTVKSRIRSGLRRLREPMRHIGVATA